MSTVPLTDTTAIDRELLRLMKIYNQEIVKRFQYVGEEAVNIARTRGSYKDQTGNLRSSIGYVLAQDGKIITRSSFEAVQVTHMKPDGTTTTSVGKKGSKTGLALAKEVVGQYPTGLVLVVVAGMEYAAAVASKGRDVLDSAVLRAETLLPQLLKQLGI